MEHRINVSCYLLQLDHILDLNGSSGLFFTSDPFLKFLTFTNLYSLIREHDFLLLQQITCLGSWTQQNLNKLILKDGQKLSP